MAGTSTTFLVALAGLLGVATGVLAVLFIREWRRSRRTSQRVQRRNAECAIGYRDEGAVPGNP